MVPLNKRLLALTTALGAFVVAPAAAQDYYAGRTIDLIIGSGPAGGYDIYGRALARHFNRHIPAPPDFSPRSRPRTAPSSPASCRAR
jgi:tripartite-type tricarboxylate transporter receptor subunit TctC